MCTTTEFEIKVSGGRITNPNVTKGLPDGSYKLVEEIQTNSTAVNHLPWGFVRIPASELSFEDDWFKNHKPKTNREQNFKWQVKMAIQRGLEDFYRPQYDPAFKKAGGICYMPGKRPAVGESYIWWKQTAKDFMPECGSRLGTKTEYIAFLAVLIKKLVASGWHVQKAWNAVCNDSQELGHYFNSLDAKRESLENTGGREVLGFYDLANTCKILEEDEEDSGFWLASGHYFDESNQYPLNHLYHKKECGTVDYLSTGWLVLERNLGPMKGN